MLLRRIARPLLASGFVIEGLQTLQNPGPLADALSPLVERNAGPGAAMSSPDQIARIIAGTEVGAAVMLSFGKMPRAAAGVLAAISALGLGTTLYSADSEDGLQRRDLAGIVSGVSRVGALLIAAADTEGKPSLGWRGRQAAGAARDRGSDLIDSVRDTVPDIVDAAKERAQNAAEYASDLVHRS